MLIPESIAAAGDAPPATLSMTAALEHATPAATGPSLRLGMTPLICLRDCGAPYRGRWVVYNTGSKDYRAIHHLKSSRKQLPEMIEERTLDGDAETSRFVRHLILHGWSIYEITDAIAASKVI